MTLASYVTLLRIFLIIPIIFLTNEINLYLNLMAFILFLIAGLTDYFDGYLARKTNTESSFGALLDLTADKLLVCLVLVWLVNISANTSLILPVLIILLRELTMSAIRQFMVEKTGNNSIKVTYIAKSKTTIQFISISCLILNPHFGIFFNYLTITLVWMAALISIFSLMNYIKAYKEYF